MGLDEADGLALDRAGYPRYFGLDGLGLEEALRELDVDGEVRSRHGAAVAARAGDSESLRCARGQSMSCRRFFAEKLPGFGAC